MSADKTSYNDLNIRTIWLVGLLSAVGLFVIITGARVLFQKWQAAEYQEKQIDVPLASVDRELQAQREVIGRYGFNEITMSPAVPVDVAMREYVQERGDIELDPPADGAGQSSVPPAAAATQDAVPEVPQLPDESQR